MKITSQEEYGLRCLLRLAAAGDGHSLTIPEIANAEGLTPSYVAKLLAVLRSGKIIDSERGRAGGYRLSRVPKEITLGAVMRVLGEPLFEDPSYCQKHAGTETEGSCVHYGACTLRELWQTLEDWMRTTLNRLTLADLLQKDQHIFDLLRTRLADAVFEPTMPLRVLSSAATACDMSRPDAVEVSTAVS